VFQRYAVVSATYGPAELAVLEILGLSSLLDASVWESFTGETPQLWDLNWHIRNAKDLIPRIVKLVEPEGIAALKAKAADLPEQLRGKEKISVILAEDTNEFSNPKRIVYGIEAISSLYTVFARISKTDDDLIVLSCDSGSDKSFDFLGAAQLVQNVKDTILALWDRVVFYRHARAQVSIETIAQSLPVLGEITSMEKSGSLAPELAEQLRRSTLSACSKFMEAGAMIPEMEGQSVHSPRALMRPEAKLLAAPVSASAGVLNPTSETDDNRDNPTDRELANEVRELRRRLDEAEKHRRPRRGTKRKADPGPN
jgi:hypothetical protein